MHPTVGGDGCAGPQRREGEGAAAEGAGTHTASRLQKVIFYQVLLEKKICYFVNELYHRVVSYIIIIFKKLISDLVKRIYF
jgi:hypothetical protein